MPHSKKQRLNMKLFVIGNGFDIGHGIPCKYSNFQEFLNDNREDILEVMEKFYYTGEDSELWSDFETSLERDINYDSLSEIIGENSPNFGSDDFRDGDWYDAQIYIEQECDELLEMVRSGFEEWIASLEISEVKKKYDLDRTALYLTFNYTDVLEKTYNIPTSNILHIHNKVGEELIFGHGKNVDEFNVQKALYGDENALLTYDEDGNVESNAVGHEQFAENAVCAFYEKMRKPTDQILNNQTDFFSRLKNIEEVVVIGHSYNDIDLPYFIKVAQSTNNNTKWTLSYFSENDKIAAEKIMSSLGIEPNLRGYKHCNLLEIEDTQLKLF
jgi:hypothetical protein